MALAMNVDSTIKWFWALLTRIGTFNFVVKVFNGDQTRPRRQRCV
jgi:hypothetical protein